MVRFLFAVLLLANICFASRHRIREQSRSRPRQSSTSSASLISDPFEQMLRDLPDPARLSANLYNLTRYPHVFGVNNVIPQMRAMMTASLAKIPNATVEVHSFTAFSTLPIDRVVNLKKTSSSDPISLDLNESCYSEDPTSCLPDITPLWAGYSPPTPGGEPTAYAPVVYANYCQESDYEYLENLGVSVKGCIVLCRYGRIFRAQKVQFAEIRGAVGVLVYTDPADDGYIRAVEFPYGPGRPPSGSQRGTYCYGQLCPGDPDPNRTEARGCGKVDILPKIPIQPISWQSAKPILESLGGLPADYSAGWQGGLPFHYHVGPGPAMVSMQLTTNATRRTGYNMISKIPGEGDLSHEVVALGCHMDAWVMGASDPLSGQSVMIEIARIMGEMYEQGWRPKRTIVFFHWDGEEYNLLGSTDFTDTHGDHVSKDMIAYVNIDGIVGNWFPDELVLSVSASPVLADLLTDAIVKTPSPIAGVDTSSLFDGTFDVLGDGSDYCSFINRLGVASLDLQWDSPELPEPQYHSRYDSFYLMQNITDPQFSVHKASVSLVGLIMYNLSTANALHLSPTFAAEQYSSYKDSIISQFPVLSKADWSLFDSALESFSNAATTAQVLVNASDPSVNDVLIRMDRQFLYAPGLPGRIYFRHLMQAPDLLNDYNSQVFPGVAYYAKTKDMAKVQEQIVLIANALNAVADSILLQVPTNNSVKIAVIVVSVSFFVAIVFITIMYLRRRKRDNKYTELPSA